MKMNVLRRIRQVILILLMVVAALLAGAYWGYELGSTEYMSFHIFHSRFPVMASQFAAVCACSGLLSIVILFEKRLFWLSHGLAAALIVFLSFIVIKLFDQLMFSFGNDAVTSVDTWFLPSAYFGLGTLITFVALQVAAVVLRIVKRGND